MPSAVPPSFGDAALRDRRPGYPVVGRVPWRSALPCIAGALRRSLLGIAPVRSGGSRVHSPPPSPRFPPATGSLCRRSTGTRPVHSPLFVMSAEYGSGGVERQARAAASVTYASDVADVAAGERYGVIRPAFWRELHPETHHGPKWPVGTCFAGLTVCPCNVCQIQEAHCPPAQQSPPLSPRNAKIESLRAATCP